MRRLLLIFLVGVGIVLALIVQQSPGLPNPAPPSPEDVRAARDLVHQLRQASHGAEADIPVPLPRINRALRMGARFTDGWRSRAAIGEGVLQLRAAMPVPGTGERLWINLQLDIPPFTDAPRFAKVRVGRINIPPGLAFWMLRQAVNGYMGAGSADDILNHLHGLHVDANRVVVRVQLDSGDRKSLSRRAFGALRGGQMPSAEDIALYYRAVREALDLGQLPDSGSVLPHLKFVLEMAQGRVAGGDPANAYTAAIFGLTRACGAKDFTLLAGKLVEAPQAASETWIRNCDNLRLNGRIDSRRHFVTASAIQAASNRGIAVSIGEFKELFDSLAGSSGFDFTDIAANNSGIRLANRMMQASADAWPELLNRIEGEADIIISFKTLPKAMPRAEFTRRYGSVDSPAYQTQMARIEALIDQLPLHLNQPG